MLRDRVHSVLRFLRDDVWRIRSRDLPRSRSFLLRQLRVLLLAVRGFAADRCNLRASALTFFTILSIVPAIAMTFGVAKGFGLESVLEQRIRGALAAQEEVADRLIEFSRSMLERARGGVMAGVGIAVLFWTVIKVLSNVEKSFNAIWGITQHRSMGRRFADYLAMMFVCPVLLVISGGVTVLVTSKVQALVQSVALLGLLAPLVSLILRLIPYCIGWGLFAFVYAFLPNTKVKITSAIVGGVVAGTLYQIMQWLYVACQISVAKYNAIYGSFAALPLFLIWLQISWLIVLFGAELSFASQNVETYEFEPDCVNASHSLRRLLALRITQMLVRGFTKGSSPATAARVSHELGVPVRLVNAILGDLVASRILSETSADGGKEVAYQPARSVDALTAAFVLEALDDRGTDAMPLVDSPELDRLAGSLRAFRDAIRSSPANVALKDI